MKYFVVAALLFLSLLLGCQKGSTCSKGIFADSGKIKVLSTTAMIDDLVAQIGKDRVEHLPLIVGQLDPHSYELVKGDVEKIQCADLLIGNGLRLEHGASLLYHLQNHPHVLLVGEEIQKRRPRQILYVGGEMDPHVWMDISLWAEGIAPIVEAFCLKDPDNAPFYRANGQELYQRLLSKHRELQQEMGQVPSPKRYLVTSHDAFHYFARAYLCQGDFEVERCIAPEGLAPEGQLSIIDIRRVVDHLAKYQIAVLFPESNVSRDALKKIRASCPHSVRICMQPLYGDAMGDEGSGADYYLGMMEHNVKVLKEEWMR
jgi:manganese/zinc/iron transport system substrate-binding protein